MDKAYITQSGQTWDQIALELYGDEHHCEAIMDANPDKLDYLIFPTGVKLKLPEDESFLETQLSENYPEWRRILDG
jgi:phage tail protein X